MKNNKKWLDAWSASPQADWGNDFFAPVELPRILRDQTIRQVIRPTFSGNTIRVQFSNTFGARQMCIGEASIAVQDHADQIRPETLQYLTFGGKRGVNIPQGASVWSDPIEFSIQAAQTLLVSIYLPDPTPTTTWHNVASHTTWISLNGNQCEDTAFTESTEITSYLFLSRLAVLAEKEAFSIVTFGDSITDGTCSTPNSGNRYPDFLSQRLLAANIPASVLNEGISGARLLHDRMGANALARLDRDVLSHPDVKTVIILMGINDIGWADSHLSNKLEVTPSADDICFAYQQIVARLHAHNIRVVAGTLLPFENALPIDPAGYYTESKEVKRQQVNAYIRNSGLFDAVIDFDKAMRDPQSPTKLIAEFDSGDCLHPNDAGYQAMANAIDLQALLS